MVDKLSLTNKENEYLAKGIAIGVGLGTVIGLIFNYVELGFATGGVLGVLASLIYSFYRRHKKNVQLNI